MISNVKHQLSRDSHCHRCVVLRSGLLSIITIINQPLYVERANTCPSGVGIMASTPLNRATLFSRLSVFIPHPDINAPHLLNPDFLSGYYVLFPRLTSFQFQFDFHPQGCWHILYCIHGNCSNQHGFMSSRILLLELLITSLGKDPYALRGV